ncbi:TonB-dependent receptor plug [Fibrella aestuarina BUZ 2]|uniref:TonB-dependent receptor plug n=1 Tax=Fibrella aestuarina BUZ 2 TaxID=1166018 RepID=I0KDJ3_9BACT|nr:TonB-dependent receptor [Fibrella aestuarina]CCH02196.1 TonB-dependent receptor plug [Fibrella aestuarina BUZ 2]
MPKQLRSLKAGLFCLPLLGSFPTAASAQDFASIRLVSTKAATSDFSPVIVRLQQTAPTARRNMRLLRECLDKLAKQHNVRFAINDQIIANKYADGTVLRLNSLKGSLDALLAPHHLTYKKVADYYVIQPAEATPALPTIPRTRPTSEHAEPGLMAPMASLQNELVAPPLHLVAVKDFPVRGTVRDSTNGQGLPGVSVVLKGTQRGTTTDADGNFQLDVPDASSVLVFSYIGFVNKELTVGGQTNLSINLRASDQALNEVVVVGYGTQKRESVTGAISTIASRDIEKAHVSTVSAALAGKIPGVSFRQNEGRPGSSAMLQVRGMGDPLFVIDGIQKDAGQFNNIAPSDIETITVLKDASASVYGSRAANGVVIVTTKRGKTGSRNVINIDSYYGWQNWTRFPKGVGAYEWMLGKADAEVNQTGKTNITQDELNKWKQGTEAGYKSFDWYDFIVSKNAPQYQFSANATGGSDKINYYFSVTRLNQDAVLNQYNFNRTNIQTNVDARIADRLKVGVQINGRIESRENPGVPGSDDYWAPRFALFRNRPTERPYANDNPLYPNNIGHNAENWALHNFDISGYWREDWRVLQTNFSADYSTPIKGLTARGVYSYYIADRLMNGHEYTYNVYSYDPVKDAYSITGGSSNPWRERGTRKILENVLQGQLNYSNTVGRHTVGATFVAERINRRDIETWVHTVPKTNALPLLQFADMDTYNDSDNEEARIGYVGRLTYNYADKYFFEAAGRRDASWKFAPDKRWGFFPSVSAGWRIGEEAFIKNLNLAALSDLKLRASYGKLGDDDINRDASFISPFAYIPGYNYASSTEILDGQIIKGSRNTGVPINNLSWFTSTIADIGLDYSLFNGKLTGEFDYFYRKRTGLRGRKYDVLVPNELGYALPDENVNSDARIGGEASLAYNTSFKGVGIRAAANVGYSRARNLQSYKPMFGNSLDYYYNSRENRWADTYWGWEVIGQFKSPEEIADYKVNVDGQGNKTLLPGDFIYRDVDGNGRIDDNDRRPIGYPVSKVPIVNFGFNLSLNYRGFDLTADFSGGSMYSYNQNWEMRWPYQNTGNLLRSMYDDRWHRTDPLNPDSPWIEGRSPALRFNDGGHSNYNKPSTWWLVNVRYIRLRTAEVGYTLPQSLTSRLKIQKARVYLNTFNLFSIDNVSQLGIDAEVTDENGLQYPQNRLVNVGVNLSF